MKRATKKILLSLIVLTGSFTGSAQWCNVTTAIPYSAEMPGITNVTLNTINRNSLPIENYPSNSYVNTGLSTTLQAGQTYSFSITHTRDAVFFPTARNNIRIWIDFNHDYSFTDPGENVVSMDYQTYGTTTGSFTVPASITPGTTRMRVTAKMSSDGGHTLPTPCDNPPDPFGYHGEIEDYDVILSTSVGLEELTSSVRDFTVYPNPASSGITVNFILEKSSDVSLGIYDVVGKRIYLAPPEKKASGAHNMSLKLSDINIISEGIYFLEISDGNKKSVHRFAVM